MSISRLSLLTALITMGAIIVFLLPIPWLAVFGLLTLTVWLCTVPVWIVQSARHTAHSKATVVRHDDGSIEVVEQP